MVDRKDCAWLRDGGWCLWHKDTCCRNSAGCCPDCVRRVSEGQHLRAKSFMQGLKLVRNSRETSACLRPNARKDDGRAVYKTCSRKRRFTTENAAHAKAVHLERKCGLVLAVYECPFCHGYHLTRQLRSSLRWNGNENFEKSA